MAADGVRVLRVAVCGSGNRSRTVWQRHLAELDGFELVGVQDVARESLDKACALGHVDKARCFLDLGELLARTRPDALVVCPVHDAHAPAAGRGLDAGCDVLVEKPLATSLSAAAALARQARGLGRTLGVVQNWRTKSAGKALRAAVADGRVGRVGQVFFRYLRDRELPHLPAYLFDEDDPLLLAMAIHHVDLFRFALGQEIVSVEGREFAPHWSRYRHPSTLQLFLETDGGVGISYVATFSSRNADIPLESIQVEGELGTIHGDSAYFEPPLLLSRRGEAAVELTAGESVRDVQGQYDLADREILLNWRDAILEGAPLVAPALDNLGTLAVLEAIRQAVRCGGRVAVPTPAAILACD